MKGEVNNIRRTNEQINKQTERKSDENVASKPQYILYTPLYLIEFIIVQKQTWNDNNIWTLKNLHIFSWFWFYFSINTKKRELKWNWQQQQKKFYRFEILNVFI